MVPRLKVRLSIRPSPTLFEEENELAETIASQEPLSTDVEDQYRRLASTRASRRVGKLTHTLYESFRRQQARSDYLRGRLAVAKERMEAAAARYQAAGAPGIFKAICEAACLSLALWGEAVVSRFSLPPLIGVATDAADALPIALAVVAATAAMERLLDPLLSWLEDVGVRAVVVWQRRAAIFTLGGLLAVGVAANLDMILKVAAARAEAARVLQMLGLADDALKVEINWDIVNVAVDALSLVIVLNAAVLLRTVLRDVPAMAQRARSIWHAAIMAHLNRRMRHAASTLETAQRSWEERTPIIEAAREGVIASVELGIQRNRERHKPVIVLPALRPTDEVDAILSDPRYLRHYFHGAPKAASTIQ